MKRKAILVIDDDAGIREALQETLEIEGYPVLCAANGKEGLELLGNIEAPGLILLDLMMPIMNGWQFMEVFIQDKARAAIPVVVITAFAEKAKDIPAQGVIKKPVDLELLLDIVQRYCA